MTKRKRPSDDNMAFGEKGAPLPWTAEHTQSVTKKVFDDPNWKVVFVVLRNGRKVFVSFQGDPAPTAENLSILEQVTENYRNALRGT